MKHNYNVGGSEDYQSGFSSGYDTGFTDGIGKCGAGVWHLMDEAPPEDECLLVQLQLEHKTPIYIAIKHSEDDDCMCGRWQIYPDDEGKLRNNHGEYPIIAWAWVNKPQIRREEAE